MSTVVLSDSVTMRGVYAKQYDNTVVVKSADDLATIDPTKNYTVDGVVDMGNQSITVPPEGLNISGVNGGRDTCRLFSSQDNFDLFVTPDGDYAGDLVINDLTIEVTGTSSRVFDLDNQGNQSAVDITNVNFVRCTSLGDLTQYRQLLNLNVGYVFLSDGYTFNGTMSGGVAVLTSIAVSFSPFTLLNAGASLIIQGSVRSDANFLAVTADSVFCDFAPSNIQNDGQFALTNVRTNATNPLPNFPSEDVKARFRNCIGIRDTYVGGEWAISTAQETSIPSANTLVKMAGVTSYNDLQWFSGNNDNEFTYDSDQEIEIDIKGSLSFVGSNNRVVAVQVRKWDDSAGSYVDVGSRFDATLNGGAAQTRVENLAFFAVTRLNENDRIEIWVENQTDSNNITCAVGGVVIVSERQS